MEILNGCCQLKIWCRAHCAIVFELRSYGNLATRICRYHQQHPLMILTIAIIPSVSKLWECLVDVRPSIHSAADTILPPVLNVLCSWYVILTVHYNFRRRICNMIDCKSIYIFYYTIHLSLVSLCGIGHGNAQRWAQILWAWCAQSMAWGWARTFQGPVPRLPAKILHRQGFTTISSEAWN